jgi:hypothetical protein
MRASNATDGICLWHQLLKNALDLTNRYSADYRAAFVADDLGLILALKYLELIEGDA